MNWRYLKKNIYSPYLSSGGIIVIAVVLCLLLPSVSSAIGCIKSDSVLNPYVVGTLSGKSVSNNIFYAASLIRHSKTNSNDFVYHNNVFIEFDDVEYTITPNLLDKNFKPHGYKRLEANEVAVSYDFANKNRLKVGDTLYIDYRDEVSKMKIAYVFAPYYGTLTYSENSGGLVIINNNSFTSLSAQSYYVHYSDQDSAVFFNRLIFVRDIKAEAQKSIVQNVLLMLLVFTAVFGFYEYILFVRYNKEKDYILINRYGLPKHSTLRLRTLEIVLRYCVVAVPSILTYLIFAAIIKNPLTAFFVFWNIASVIAVLIVVLVGFGVFMNLRLRRLLS